MSDPSPNPKNPAQPDSGAYGQPSFSDGSATQPGYGQGPYVPQGPGYTDPQQPYGAPTQGYPDPNQPYAAPAQSYPGSSQPYGAPTQAYPDPNQPYGAPAQSYQQEPYYAYPPQDPNTGYAAPTYGQPGYGQGYPLQQGYPQQSYPPAEPARPQANATLGLIGLAGVVIFAIILVVTSAMMGHSIGEFVQLNGVEVLENPDSTSPEFLALAQSIQGVSMLSTFSVFAGLVAWITSIVAFVRRAGRGYALGGILLGIAAPIIAIITIVVVLVPYIPV